MAVSTVTERRDLNLRGSVAAVLNVATEMALYVAILIAIAPIALLSTFLWPFDKDDDPR